MTYRFFVLLTRSLVKAFCDDKHALNSQLLFTTHDTNLLNQQLLPIDSASALT